MVDFVIGCIYKYNFDQIKLWVNSLLKSKFDGRKVIIGFDIDKATIDQIKNHGFEFYTTDTPNFGSGIMVERFLAVSELLKANTDARYCVLTDVGDVVFQNNPIKWIEQHIGNHQIIVGSESIRYRDEPWNYQNMVLSFGSDAFQIMSDKLVYNAGTIAGQARAIQQLCDSIYQKCKNMPRWIPGGGGPDQAALNIILQTQTDPDRVLFAPQSLGWCAQLGASQLDKLRDVLTEPPAKIIDKTVTTADGFPFALVHQYPRFPAFNNLVKDLYQ